MKSYLKRLHLKKIGLLYVHLCFSLVSKHKVYVMRLTIVYLTIYILDSFYQPP
jgi:hypothetical protein